jgi:hypothetical protein
MCVSQSIRLTFAAGNEEQVVFGYRQPLGPVRPVLQWRNSLVTVSIQQDAGAGVIICKSFGGIHVAMVNQMFKDQRALREHNMITRTGT